MTIDSSFPFATRGVPGQRVRHGFNMPFPFQGTDRRATRHLEVLASLPGCIGIIDPASLRTLPGGFQTLSSPVGGHVWTTPAAETCSLVATAGAGKLVAVSASPFQPDVGVDVQGRQARTLVLPQDRFTILMPVKITAGTGTRLFLGCPDTPVGNANVRFGVGMLTGDQLGLFHFQPGTSTRSQSTTPITEGSLEIWTMTFSIERGVRMFKGTSLTPDAVDDTGDGLWPLAASEALRIVQLFGHTASGANGAPGEFGAFCVYDQDFSAPAYLQALDTAQRVLSHYYTGV